MRKFTLIMMMIGLGLISSSQAQQISNPSIGEAELLAFNAEELNSVKNYIDLKFVKDKAYLSTHDYYQRALINKSILYNEALYEKYDYPILLGEIFESITKGMGKGGQEEMQMEWMTFARTIALSFKMEGEDLMKQGMFRKAYDYLTYAVEINRMILKQGGEIRCNMGNTLSMAGLAAFRLLEIDVASALCMESIDRYNGDPDAYDLLAGIYLAENRVEEARKLVVEGIGKFPKSAELRKTEINIILGEEAYEDAIDRMLELLKIDGNNENILFMLGAIYEEIDEDSKAIASYEMCLNIQYADYNCLYNLGVIYFNLAAEISQEMGKLGYSEEEERIYQKMKSQRNQYLNTSLPYFKELSDYYFDDEVEGLIRTIGKYLSE